MNFEVDYSQLNNLLRDFKEAGGNAQPLVKQFLTNSVIEVQKNTRDLAPHFTGGLQRSIQVEESYPSAKVKVNSPYGLYVEEGTNPHMPPVAALQRWADSKGINAWALAMSIKKKGTKAHPFFKPGIEKSQEYINQQLNYVGNRLIKLMAGKA